MVTAVLIGLLVGLPGAAWAVGYHSGRRASFYAGWDAAVEAIRDLERAARDQREKEVAGG